MRVGPNDEQCHRGDDTTPGRRLLPLEQQPVEQQGREYRHEIRAQLDDAGGGPNRILSVFMMDIDHFKQFNDTNGHLCGDELLKDMSKLLSDHVREGECVGRFGGEEFLFLMPGTSKSEALQAADRFRALVAGREFSGEEGQPGGRLTISGGVATWPIDGEDVESVLEKADQALYKAKRSGRNRVMAYTPHELASISESDLVFATDPLAEAAKPEPPEFDETD